MLDRNTSRSTAIADTWTRPFRPAWHTWWWLNVILLGLTFVSTTVFGFALEQSFQSGRSLDLSMWLVGYRLLVHADTKLLSGTMYSVPLLLILLAHEFGHYAWCRRHNISASLPFFGPSPLLMGTIGAFIWIRSPIYRRRALFDVGVSGPVLGFITLIPFLIVGVWKSKIGFSHEVGGDYEFGVPVLIRAIERLHFPGVSSEQICLHPMAIAAWAGLLATAINLLPIGQLDGGHLTYAVLGERGHRVVSGLVIAAMAVAGFAYWPWAIWAVAMFFFRRHPLIHDSQPLGRERTWLAVLSVILFVLSFSLVPVRELHP